MFLYTHNYDVPATIAIQNEYSHNQETLATYTVAVIIIIKPLVPRSRFRIQISSKLSQILSFTIHYVNKLPGAIYNKTLSARDNLYLNKRSNIDHTVTRLELSYLAFEGGLRKTKAVAIFCFSFFYLSLSHFFFSFLFKC